jgi:hypothetical protein
MSSKSFVKEVAISYWPGILPIVGYLIFVAEYLFAGPNPKWVMVLLLWSLCVVLLSLWLIRGRGALIFDFLETHASRIAFGLIIVAAAVAIVVSTLQAEYFTMGARSRDMAYYNQILWNTLRGNILVGNLNQEELFSPPVTSDFALHVSPFLLVGVLPIYAIFPNFLTLLILRDLALAAAAWPLFLVARDHIGKVGGLAAVVLYFSNPTVMSQIYQEFTPLHLAPLPFFLAFRAFDRQMLGSFIVWAIVAMSMREDVAVTIVGFGLWAFLTRRQPRWLLVGILLPLVWWAVATLVVQPAFGRWGNNVSEIALAGGKPARFGIYQVLNPLRALDILSNGGAEYIYRLLRPVGFLAVLGLEGVIAMPVIGANLFYSLMSPEGINPTLRLALLPACVLIGATVLIVGRFVRNNQQSLRLFPVMLILFLPAVSLLDGIKDSLQDGWNSYTLENDADALRKVVKMIPDNASVAAPGYALPALSNRAKLYNLPALHLYLNARPDYLLLDRQLDRVTGSPILQPRYAELLADVSKSETFEKVFQEGDYMLLKRIEHETIK